MFARPLLLALAAGLVSATGFAPLDLWPVLLAALAMMMWLCHQAPTLRAAMLRGWVFGVGHFAVVNNWIQHAFDYQDKMPPILGYFAVVLLALYLAIYPALAAGLAWRFAHIGGRRHGFDGAYVLAFAAAWIVTEWLRGTFLTGYPWNPLAAAWLPVAGVAQAAALIGTYAMSGVTILAAGMLVTAVLRSWRFTAAVAVLLIVLALGIPIDTPAPAGGERPLVRIVQPNIGQEGVLEDPDGYAERVLQRLIAMSGQPGATPRLVVWPEGMVNQHLEDGYPPEWYWRGFPDVTRARIAATLGPRDTALVSGNALFFDAQRQIQGAGNSVFVLGSDAQLHGRYDKAHLVPFGEYLPLRTILAPLGIARLVMGEVDFVPGPGPASIDVPGFGKVGMQVCYEIVFSGQTVDAANRPDMIFNPSNDAWFGVWGPPQHLAQARLRAIEEGLPVLRATPTGISAVIDADGRLVATVPHREAGAIEVPLPRPHAATPFARIGNLAVALVAGLLLLLAVANRRFAR